jgi:opacity protein-like surface antigen
MIKKITIGFLSAAFLLGGSISSVNAKPVTTRPIALPSVRVASPNGGQIYHVGDIMKIKWDSKNVPAETKLSIELTRLINTIDGVGYTGSGIIASAVAPSGSINWIIPKTLGESDQYQIRIGGSVAGDEGKGFWDTSDTTFSILGGHPIIIDLSSSTVCAGGMIRVYADTRGSNYPDAEFAIIGIESLDSQFHSSVNYTYKKDSMGRWYDDYIIPSWATSGTWVVRLVTLFKDNAAVEKFEYPTDIQTTFQVIGSPYIVCVAGGSVI